MTKTWKLRYRGSRRLAATLVMLAVSVGAVALSGFWYANARAAYLSPEGVAAVPSDRAEAVVVGEQDKTDYGVESAAQFLGADGSPLGYVIVSAVHGYKSVIRVESTFAADGQTLVGIRVLSQDETEYLGTRIRSEEFTALFEGRRLPMKLWSAATKGSPIDALSGSTVSSQAVVDAVNNAYAYLQNRAA